MARPKPKEKMRYMFVKIKESELKSIVAYANSKGFYNISEFVRVTLLGVSGCPQENKTEKNID